ncbi:MAG: hypothetical protein HY365_02725, partial [Candidatus Aenigmarchaeota archaeon]|nr:hypothetical protein [Candidatus Aenigmarchaeota archaeon]
MIIRRATKEDLPACENMSRIEEFRMAHGEYPSSDILSNYVNGLFLV